MPPKRKKKAKTPKTQSQRQSVTVNINNTKPKRSKSRRRSTLPPASYPPQLAPTFVTSNQDFDRITPLLAGILQSQQQMFRDISVPTQPMIKAEEPTPPPRVPPPLPPRPTSNFQNPNSLQGFGAPPPLQSSASAKSTGSVQSSVMGSPKDFDNVENDFVSTSLPQKKAPPTRSKLDEPLPDLKPIPEPVQPSKKSMIPDKSFVSKTYNPRYQEILKTEPPDARSESLDRATEEGKDAIERLQSILGTQSRPQETDAPPNIRPLESLPTRERSLSNMLNIKETPPPNIPETMEEIPKKAPERRLSISEKKIIRRQKAEEESLPPRDSRNVLKTEQLDRRSSRASMEEVIEESKQRQKMSDEDLFKIAKQGGIISSVLPPKPPKPAEPAPAPEKAPAYVVDTPEPNIELDFRGKEIQETKQKKEQPTRVGRVAPPLPPRPPSKPRGTSLDRFTRRSISSDNLNQTRSIPQRIPVIPPPRTRRSPLSDSPKFV